MKKVNSNKVNSKVNTDNNNNIYNYLETLPIENIELSQLRVNPNNPRRQGDRDKLTHLNSLVNHGLKKPLLIYPDKDGYIVIQGNLRLLGIQYIQDIYLDCQKNDIKDANLLSIAHGFRYFTDGIPCRVIDKVLSQEVLNDIAQDFDRLGRPERIIHEDIITDIKRGYNEAAICAKYGAELLAVKNLTVERLCEQKKSDNPDKALKDYLHGRYQYCQKFAEFFPDDVWEKFNAGRIEQKNLKKIYDDIINVFKDHYSGDKNYNARNLTLFDKMAIKYKYCPIEGEILSEQETIKRRLNDKVNAIVDRYTDVDNSKEKTIKIDKDYLEKICLATKSTILQQYLMAIILMDNRHEQIDNRLFDIERAESIIVRDIIGVPMDK